MQGMTDLLAPLLVITDDGTYELKSEYTQTRIHGIISIVYFLTRSHSSYLLCKANGQADC